MVCSESPLGCTYICLLYWVQTGCSHLVPFVKAGDPHSKFTYVELAGNSATLLMKLHSHLSMGWGSHLLIAAELRGDRMLLCGHSVVTLRYTRKTFAWEMRQDIVALVFLTAAAAAAAGSHISSNVWMWVLVVGGAKWLEKKRKKQKAKCFPEVVYGRLRCADIWYSSKAAPPTLIGCWSAATSQRLFLKTEWQTQLLQKGKCSYGLLQREGGRDREGVCVSVHVFLCVYPCACTGEQ